MESSQDLQDNEVTCVVIYRRNNGQSNDTLSCSAIFLSSSHILVPGSILGDDFNSKNLGTFEVAAKFICQTVEFKTAKLVTLWRCGKMSEVLNTLFVPSDISPNSPDEDPTTHINQLSSFVLLELAKKDNLAIGHLEQHTAMGELSIGIEVLACSTPFGSSYVAPFFNSWSSGIISKCIDSNHVGFLSDLTCVPGGQGGIVFRKDTMAPSGIVIHPVIWRADECTGLSIVGSLKEILHSLYSHCQNQNLTCSPSSALHLPPPITYLQHQFSTCDRLVRVRNGSIWGSGILISDIYVLTCSHIIKGHQNDRIFIGTIYDTMETSAIYQSQAEENFDVAILKLGSRVLRPLPPLPPIQPVKVGMHVKAEGYGIFEYSRTPTVTKGIISKISNFGTHSHSIATTCKVHSGSSGGVITDEHGSVVGMITSNTYDSTNKICYTNVSLALSLHLLYPQIMKLCTNNDISGFIELETSLCDVNWLKSKL